MKTILGLVAALVFTSMLSTDPTKPVPWSTGQDAIAGAADPKPVPWVHAAEASKPVPWKKG